MLYMDAVLTGNQSLSRRAAKRLLWSIAAIFLVFGFLLTRIGAGPAPIFLGLTFAGLALAFCAQARKARSAEVVQVSADQVVVLRRRGARDQVIWRSPTAFTRVELETPDDDEAHVWLRLSRAATPVAEVLGAPERRQFAAALRRAIQAARAERYGA
jgi:uncharacterized membrane protein